MRSHRVLAQLRRKKLAGVSKPQGIAAAARDQGSQLRGQRRRCVRKASQVRGKLAIQRCQWRPLAAARAGARSCERHAFCHIKLIEIISFDRISYLFGFGLISIDISDVILGFWVESRD